MANIITARFQEQQQVERAVALLAAEGFVPEQVTAFYVSSPGQHDLYPIGGDEMQSPGTEDATTAGGAAAAVGGTVGLVTGLATLPLLGPAAVVAAAGVGAWMGSLYGALDGIKDKVHPEADATGEARQTIEPPRKSGMLVAVAVETLPLQDVAINVLRGQGGMDIGHAEGKIVDGDWTDFDPLAPVIPVAG